MLFFYTDTLQNLSPSNLYIQSRKQNLHDSAVASLTCIIDFNLKFLQLIMNSEKKSKNFTATADSREMLV